MKSDEGGCLCGKVRFRVTAEALKSGYCHCRMCQRILGSASRRLGHVPRHGFFLDRRHTGNLCILRFPVASRRNRNQVELLPLASIKSTIYTILMPLSATGLELACRTNPACPFEIRNNHDELRRHSAF